MSVSMADELKSAEELISFLEGKLEAHEKNLTLRQSEYESLQNDYYELQEKFNGSRQKYKRAALILTDFLEDMLNSQPTIISPERDLHLNLEKIKETPFEHLSKEDKVTLVLVLLKQLQPYFSAQNLTVSDAGNATGGLAKTRNLQGRFATDDGGINKILNNINVQTRKFTQPLEG